MDKDEYDRLVKDPYTWYRYGQRMQFAANKILKLWQDAINGPEVFPLSFRDPKSRWAMYDHFASQRELFSTYLMLIGYAIENMTKGLDLVLKIKQNAPEIQKPCFDIRSLGLQYHDENLSHLKHVKKQFNIEITKEEEEAAELAVNHLLWAAKYATPINAEEDELPPRNLLDCKKYADSLNTLYTKLEETLSKKR